MNTTDTPSWPSLYNPGLEILHIEHHLPKQEGGAYLSHASDVFRFTLYWTLIFYTPLFLVCGSYAFWNYAFPPSPRSITRQRHDNMVYQLTNYHDASPIRPPKPPKPNERRSRLAFALIVLLTFLTMSVAGAVIGSAVLGFTLLGLYRSAEYSISTWIPFLLAVMQVVVGLLSIWPNIIDTI